MNTKIKVLTVLGLLVLSFTIVAGSALAKKNDDGTRPGWGWGDTNHEHTGPPGGPSVHPRDR